MNKLKEVYQTCDSRNCKYEGTIHHVVNNTTICTKCKKEIKINQK